MKHVSLSSTQKFENGSSCKGYEYGGNSDIDGAIAVISGRYPESGWVTNEISSELVYVLSGVGHIVTKSTRQPLAATDVVLIETNELYYFEGDSLRLFSACTPAWTSEQHKNIKD